MNAFEARRISDFTNKKNSIKKDCLSAILFLIQHHASKGDYTIDYRCYNHSKDFVIKQLRNLKYEVIEIPDKIDTYAKLMISWS